MSWNLGLIVRVPGPRDDGFVEAVVVRYENGSVRAISYMFIEDDVELPVAAAARECGLDDAGREALYKAVGAGKVEARELKEGQQLPRRYVRLEAVREWAANVYKPR